MRPRLHAAGALPATPPPPPLVLSGHAPPPRRAARGVGGLGGTPALPHLLARAPGDRPCKRRPRLGACAQSRRVGSGVAWRGSAGRATSRQTGQTRRWMKRAPWFCTCSMISASSSRDHGFEEDLCDCCTRRRARLSATSACRGRPRRARSQRRRRGAHLVTHLVLVALVVLIAVVSGLPRRRAGRASRVQPRAGARRSPASRETRVCRARARACGRVGVHGGVHTAFVASPSTCSPPTCAFPCAGGQRVGTRRAAVAQ